MNISTEITIATLLEIGSVVGAGLIAWATLRAVVSSMTAGLEQERQEVRRAHSRITEVQRELAEYKERQAGELVGRETLREVEKRLLDEIRLMQTQLRDLYEKLIARSGYPPS